MFTRSQQGDRFQNPDSGLDNLRCADQFSQTVHAGILHSTHGTLTLLSSYTPPTNTTQNGLSRRYQIPIWIGFGLVIACFLASIIAIFASCRPFYKNWQINPDPGSKPSLSHFITIHRANTQLDICQPAISKPVIAVTFAANLLTDPYIIFIPIPMLWKSSLKLIKKIATTIVLSAGVFILVCATLKSVLLLVVSPTQHRSPSQALLTFIKHKRNRIMALSSPTNGAPVKPSSQS